MWGIELSDSGLRDSDANIIISPQSFMQEKFNDGWIILIYLPLHAALQLRHAIK